MNATTEVSTAAKSADARLRVMAARVIAQQRWPYVAGLLFTLRLVEVPHEELPTMAVDDGWRMYYSPVFVMGEKPEALATVLLHEALHCLHGHSSRFSALSQPPHLHPLWNYAGDAAINAVLDESEMPWPTVTPVRYQDLTQYGVTSEQTTEGAYFALLDYRDQHPEELTEAADCGSVVGGSSREYELAPTDPDAPRVRADQQASVRDRVAHDILEHSRNRGDVPGDIQRWAESILQPKVDWREALAGQVRRRLSMVAGRRDYVYTRPSRRQEAIRLSGSNVVLPAMRQPALPRVACVVDTSGSLSNRQLRDFASELVGIARASGVSTGLSVIPCDSIAYPTQMVRTREDVERLSFPGGGGTDMGVGIAAAAEVRPTVHVIVVFTDGYTPWPEEMPRGVDSVIVLLTDPLRETSVPAWAQVITMESI